MLVNPPPVMCARPLILTCSLFGFSVVGSMSIAPVSGSILSLHIVSFLMSLT